MHEATKDVLEKILFEKSALQARVNELERELYEQLRDARRDQDEMARCLSIENTRLQKLVDMNQKVIDAARQYKKATESRDMPEFKLERALFDAIDEMDEELKCPMHDKPGCACG